jgi:biotin carboxylase
METLKNNEELKTVVNKKILIVGCGMSQIPTFQSAYKLGVRTVGVDFNPDACAVELADEFEQCDIKDEEGVLEIALKHKVDGIVVPGTDFPATGAYVSERLGFPTTSLQVAELCTSKIKQKEFLRNEGFLVPRVYKIEKGLSPYKVFLPNGIYVIKPDDNMAARGTLKVHYDSNNDWPKLIKAIEVARHFSITGDVLAEKFEEGMELSVDSLVYDGEVYVFAVADRHFALDPYFIEVGHTMPSVLNQEMQREVITTFTRAVKALGITFGSAKGDLKISKDGIMILEIANRISGGVLSGWTVPYSTGYYPHEDLIKIHLGLEPELNEVTLVKGAIKDNKFYYSAERNLLSIPGELSDIQRFNMNSATANFVHIHPRIGDTVNFPYDNAKRIGSIVTIGVTREGAIKAGQEMAKDTLLRLKPNNEMTEKWIELDNNFKMFQTIKKENDWYGNDFTEALNKVFIATTAKYEDIKDDHDFWKYFYKGGIQGAVYYIDSNLKKGEKK